MEVEFQCFMNERHFQLPSLLQLAYPFLLIDKVESDPQDQVYAQTALTDCVSPIISISLSHSELMFLVPLKVLISFLPPLLPSSTKA